MKLTTNYTLQTNASSAHYFSGDDSFTVYDEDGSQIEIFGIDRDTLLIFARNLLVVDVVKHTVRSRIDTNELRLLTEIKDALTEYLKED